MERYWLLAITSGPFQRRDSTGNGCATRRTPQSMASAVCAMVSEPSFVVYSRGTRVVPT